MQIDWKNSRKQTDCSMADNMLFDATVVLSMHYTKDELYSRVNEWRSIQQLDNIREEECVQYCPISRNFTFIIREDCSFGPPDNVFHLEQINRFERYRGLL